MLQKRLFDLTIGIAALLFSLPLVVFISLAIIVSSGFPVIFGQKRWGRGKRVFTLYKFRTMVAGAEAKKKRLIQYNEADGPVFKITNDPRFTKFGKILAHTGLDELPQLINVVFGQMSLVGPRPLPVGEAKKVPEKYNKRFSVLPGITSTWIVKGSHAMSFEEWMKLDLEYIKEWTIWEDFKILFLTWKLMLNWALRQVVR